MKLAVKEKKLPQTPQQQQFVAQYNNPESPSFGNAYKTAISVGMSESYARTITVENPKWFQDNCRHGELMELAEERLKHYLTFKPENPTEMKVQQDTAKFVAGSLGKEHYSTRQEVRSDSQKKSFSPQTKLIVEKILDDFLQPKETRVRLEHTL